MDTLWCNSNKSKDACAFFFISISSDFSVLFDITCMHYGPDSDAHRHTVIVFRLDREYKSSVCDRP